MGRKRDEKSLGNPSPSKRKQDKLEDSKCGLVYKKKSFKADHEAYFSGSTEEDDGWAPWPCEHYAKAATGQIFGHYLSRSASFYWFGDRKLFDKSAKFQPSLELSYYAVLNTRDPNMNKPTAQNHYRLNGGI